MARKRIIIIILVSVLAVACAVGLFLLLKKDNASEGLSYKPINDYTEYEVTGIGACEDTEIIIPTTYNGKKVTSIGERAFASILEITSVKIPNTVKNIGAGAFTICNGLKTIRLPDSVTSIGAGAFENCDNLLYNELGGLKYLGSAKNRYLYLAGAYDYSITDANIHKKCKFIGSIAFHRCQELESVSVPNGVISIGEGAFKDARNLTEINIPSSVTEIGKEAFYYIGLEKVTFEKDSKLKRIGEKAFYCCKVTSIEIPNGVTSIGTEAFRGCEKLSEVTIPNSVLSIEKGVFLNCDSLKNIVVPDSVVSFGSSNFPKNLEKATVPASFCKFSDNEHLKEVIITSGEELPDNAFGSCPALTTVKLPNTLKTIKAHEFSYCYELTDIQIPSSVTSIGNNAFRGCSKLTKIVIPKSVQNIGEMAFYYCSSLTIYCEAENQPTEWSESWNVSSLPVVWGYQGN